MIIHLKMICTFGYCLINLNKCLYINISSHHNHNRLSTITPTKFLNQVNSFIYLPPNIHSLHLSAINLNFSSYFVAFTFGMRLYLLYHVLWNVAHVHAHVVSYICDPTCMSAVFSVCLLKQKNIVEYANKPHNRISLPGKMIIEIIYERNASTRKNHILVNEFSKSSTQYSQHSAPPVLIKFVFEVERHAIKCMVN